MLTSLHLIISLGLLLSNTLTATVRAHPYPGHLTRRAHPESPPSTTTPEQDIQALLEGNARFRAKVAASANPNLLKDLRMNGQKPGFAFIGCSDSRVNEGTIFSAPPGSIFTQRNIANQFISNDINSLSVLAYGVGHLGVRHVIVMGHYGCGGVAAAIASPPNTVIDAGDGALYSWIEPIRRLYFTSNRKEIVDLRNKNANITMVKAPEFAEPGFKALVEENVKMGVQAVANSPVMRNHYMKLRVKLPNPNNTTKVGNDDGKKMQEVWIHGWVYNIEDGTIKDLNVTVPPSGLNSTQKVSKPAVKPKPVTSKPEDYPVEEEEEVYYDW